MGKRSRTTKLNGSARVLSEDANYVETIIADLHTHNHTADSETQKKKSQQSKPRSCRRDAYCIQRLGMEKWEKLKKDRSKTPAPNMKRRDIGTEPCGLENCGNFCYVNSFLQIWFNDLDFRKCIFEWREDPDFQTSSKMDIQKVMNCLQRLFITMQITPYEYTNATELTQLLRLDDEQHDVQEFSICFFQALDRHLAKHPNGEKCRQFFRKHFEGRTQQNIKCKCGRSSESETEFRSLQLHINGSNSLSAALADYFKPEEIADYRCDGCGQQGVVERSTKCLVVPPVLLLQLNRYSFDQNGRSKKITNPIQFPRQLSESAVLEGADPESKYELCAVMIHEGQNASCGHYYDLIKDPNSSQWFAYNDRQVTECQKTPGVTTEKAAIQRGNAEQKGCYALIYRKMDKKKCDEVIDLDSQKMDLNLIELLNLAPQDVVNDIEKKLSAKFQDESREGNRSHEIWSSCIDDRHSYLEHMWNCLAVHNGRQILNKPDSVAHLPTDLLVEIQRKELQAVQKMKDLDVVMNGKSGNTEQEDDCAYLEEGLERLGHYDQTVETEEEFYQRLMNTCAQIREERQTADQLKSAKIHANSNFAPPDNEALKLLYVIEPLEDSRMKLCRHGKVDIEELRNGKVKIVTRKAAEKLLADYHIGIRFERSDPEEINDTGSLMTGSDLCTECIEMVQKEEETRRDLDDRCAIADKILKRFAAKNHGYEFPTSDAYYISKTQLKTYKKLVVQEMNYQKEKGTGPPTVLLFSTRVSCFQEMSNSPKTSEENGETEDAETSLDVPSHKRRRIDSESTNGEEPQQQEGPKSAMSKYSSSSGSSTPSQSSKLETIDEVKTNGTIKENGDTHAKDVQAEDVQMEDDDPPPSSVEGRSNDEKDEPEIEIVGEVIRNPTAPVIFNGDLICQHGGITCVEKKLWVFEHEWNQLVKGKFEHVHELPATKTEECPMCIEQNNTEESVKSDCAAKLYQINQTIGKTFKNFERRCSSLENGISSEFKMAICSKFLYRFRHAVKVRSTSIPKICQECLLCQKHKRPFMPFQEISDNFDHLKRIDEASAQISGTRSLFNEASISFTSSYDKRSTGPLPCTEDEWIKLNSEYSNVCGDEEWPEAIHIEDGTIKNFCSECFEEYNRILHQMRCYYPQGANIFVKLKEDEDDGAKPTTSRVATSTRRSVHKNIFRTKLNSDETVRDLKLKLYERTKQTPSDQLILLNGQVLEDKMTLQEAGVYGDNADEPLTLIAQQHVEINETERRLEKGFRDTALSTFV
ncbi:USP domain-containing protein [Aphelenchoides besseyi]|nr:USP domain-containing protein [Aphelenchoides besseyi]